MKLISVIVVMLVAAACSACAGRQYPHEAPTMTDVAVVKITSINEEGKAIGYCTAWKLDEERMMTAGHCCVYDAPKEGEDPLLVALGAGETEEKEVPMFTMDGPHAIPGETATVIARDEDHDACVLKGRMRGAPIALAHHDPALGDRVWTAGYPHTTFLISEGLWSGRDDDGQAVASVAVWGGASGSPVLDSDGRCVGILVGYYKPFDALSFITPIEWVRVLATLTR